MIRLAKPTQTQLFFFLLIILALGLMSSWSRESQNSQSFKEKLHQKGSLVVLTRNGPTTYYMRPHGPTGIEYDMATAFATDLGVTPQFKLFGSTEALLQAIQQGEGDFVAAGLTITTERQKHYQFGPSYQRIQQKVVCNRESEIPAALEDLAGVSILIPSASSYAERLRHLQQVNQDLLWTETASLSTAEIFAKITDQEFDCTVADSHIIDINQRYFPDLIVAMPLGEQQELAWLLPRNANGLKAFMDTWFANQQETQFFENLLHRYYGHVKIFDYVDTMRFYRHSQKRLPRYEAWFQQAAENHDLPWTLLAAQSYQESHWNPRAKSPTGVRGIMMLTRSTAAELGIRNRLNPTKSILGGARYLDTMRNRLPEDIQEPDRTWYALAAYNVGFGHLRDAMRLTRELGKDPYQWKELKTVLPLLSRKRYFTQLPHGYARGTEPVRYVERIRQYQDMLEQRFVDI